MFERSAQVNAKFTGGSTRQAELVAELRALGLREDQVSVIERADKGDWRQAAAPGLLARLRGRGGPAAAGPADLLVLALGVNGLLTVAVVARAALLVVRLTEGKTQSLDLLRDAALIWVANIVTFALWYWSIDGGGPAKRHPGRHASTDFAFPQQQQEEDEVVEGWSPTFLDYLFLAFNTSTAFSPTDTMVLSRPAKLLLMAQSTIALAVVAVLAARS